jgi:hypothetical protein
MTSLYIFANDSGSIPLQELDSNFAIVSSLSNVAVTVSGNAQPNITSTGTLTSLSVTGNISSMGNISGNYIIGNGHFLTGISSGNGNSNYSNSNVASYLTVLTTNINTTADITASYFIGNGTFLTGLYNNSNVANYLPTFSGNLAAGNISTAGTATVTGTATVGNLSTTGTITALLLDRCGTSTSPMMYTHGNISSHANADEV